MIVFGRKWQVSIGEVDVSGLDLTFDIVKSTAREPNTAEVRVYNLSSESRASIESEQHARLIVRAGYEDPPNTLFIGNARRIYTERDDKDFVTTILASDSGRELQTARISRSYAPGTPVKNAIRDAVSALGIGEGNLADFESSYRQRNGSMTFPDGYAAAGPARRVLDTLLRAAGLRWSVQDGALVVMQSGRPLERTAVLLSAESGMVGTPTKDEHGVVSVQALIQSGLEPGRRISIDSDALDGTFEVKRIVYKGETEGNAWYANIEARPL